MSNDELASDLVQQVRSALAHLYDVAYLQNHDLATILNDVEDADGITRAQMLRRLLLDSIESLKPANQADVPPEATRAYAILTYRYVDGLSIEEITQRLNLSRRQVYREHAKGLKAIASLLQQQFEAALDPAASDPLGLDAESGESNRFALAKAEVDRLGHHVAAESLDLSRVLEEICNLLRPRLAQRGVDIAIVSPPPWPKVVADRTMLRQALLNLLSHALDVVQHSVFEITASQEPGGLLLRLSEVPNSESTDATARRAQRRGVGLAVAKELIEMQGGRLAIQEEAGAWRAEIYLATEASKTVLVIDDNADLIKLFQRYAGGHRLTVVGARGGREAMEMAADLCPQLIVLDLMMPHQDGWEILQQLKSDPTTQAIPVAVCSVLNETQLAMAMGASDYLTKPVSQTDFLELLRRWLGKLQPVG